MSFLQQSDRRTVSFWDVTVKGYSRKRKVNVAEPLDLKTLFLQLQKLRISNFRTGPLEYEVKSKRISVWLDAISFDKDMVTLLFLIMDDKAAKQTYRNLKTKRVRQAIRYEDEKSEFSAHVIISLNSDPNVPHMYPCIVEDTPNASMNLLISALNRFLKDTALKYEKHFLQTHPDGSFDSKGQPVMMKTYSKLSATGHPGEDFKKSLREGKISGLFAITKFEVDKSIDSTNIVKPIRKELAFSVSKGVADVDNYTYLERVRNYSFNEKCDVLKVQFKDQDENSYTLNVDPASGGLLDERKFIKRCVLTGFSSELNTSINGQFNFELIRKAKELLIGEIDVAVGDIDDLDLGPDALSVGVV
ncbi:hypothetical protein L4174_005455 [Photobacterium sp. CCB-ST2H9]|uniref:hypothetical protein n=1 Tax=Photobacterium sp. CCB-ST2H9 TaxID=2912855 RepID=UPI002004E77A|nr:hypothetical protein [Photobacterium sp. CCB-ST2H9]UTM58289.1 hypothetical protein L4174_005455 [Photobacterium sp. CCB-ST2H9]